MEPTDPFASDPLNYEPPEPSLPARQAPWLETLNDPQREAVEALDGPVLVLARAGTGKTRVLTTRLAQNIHANRARPYQIMAVTFTNRAAREMRERVEALICPASEELWLGTFHALDARILRRRSEAHRRAMMALIGDTEHLHFAHPLFWAPFVVVGEGGLAQR